MFTSLLMRKNNEFRSLGKLPYGQMPILIAFSVMSVLLPKADILEGTAKSPFMTLSGH